MDASISQAPHHIVAEAPVSEPQFKRARLTAICDQHDDSVQCPGGQPLQCVDEGTIMSETEQQAFLLALARAMQSLGDGSESVLSRMIRLEQWDLLKAVQGSVDLLHACLSQKHAGALGCWKRSTALKTITRVCQEFQAIPLLQDTIAHLQRWRAYRRGCRQSLEEIAAESRNHAHCILLEFSEVWNAAWEGQKQQLGQMEHWQQLQKLSHTRETLQATLSVDAKVSTPDFQQTLVDLKALKALGCFGRCDSLDRAKDMLDPQNNHCGTLEAAMNCGM